MPSMLVNVWWLMLCLIFQKYVLAPRMLRKYAETVLSQACLEKLWWPPSCMILKPSMAKFRPISIHNSKATSGGGVKNTSVV